MRRLFVISADVSETAIRPYSRWMKFSAPSANTLNDGGLRGLLRRGTASCHTLAERAFDIKRRMGSLPDYAGALAILWRLHLVTDRALEAAGWAGLPRARTVAQARLDWLRQDLASLGVEPPATDLTLTLADEAEALGCLYVMEGSMLGSLVLARLVQTRLGIGTLTGARFLHGFAEETDAIWHEFVAELDSRPVAGTGPGALAGAIRTFELFSAAIAE